MSSEDGRFMSRALQQAAKGLYTTHPNPRVGCLLVRDGEIVGEGHHQIAGGPHAERHALAAAGERARGATAYVTLEPCCHQGKTPPCTQALIDAGVKRVVVAMEDPNPLVAGKGLQALRDAGIEVEVGLLENQAETLNPGFIKRMRSGTPFVRCKLAMSLDGRTAMSSGESQWITGEAARTDVQRLRARSDAIATGIGTVLADDPSMNVRLHTEGSGSPERAIRQPMRVVLDPQLLMPEQARMLALPGETLVVCSVEQPRHREKLTKAGVEVVCLPGGPSGIDLHELIAFLGDRGINELLIETGATLAGAALDAGVIDELVIYVAPHIMGSSARALFAIPGLERMQDRIDLAISDLRMVGSDIRITCQTAGGPVNPEQDRVDEDPNPERKEA